MRSRALIIAAASAAAATAATAQTPTPTAPAPAPATPTLSRNGLGPVTIGMTLAQAQRASGIRFRAPTGDVPSCRYAISRDPRLGLALMVARQNRVVRLDLMRPRYATAKGIRVGSTQKAVVTAYPTAVVTRHKYLARGKEIWVGARPMARTGRAMVFETNGARVTNIRAGKLPQVGYVEGCS
ncbi:MAG: hypothetical protein KDC33_06120 [Thermoleophilia bacterium]|nr:hypothetical protein [Thermoleophilia bacterium]